MHKGKGLCRPSIFVGPSDSNAVSQPKEGVEQSEWTPARSGGCSLMAFQPVSDGVASEAMKALESDEADS